MDNIGYDEYLEALAKVNRFHAQFKNDVQEVKDYLRVISDSVRQEGIIGLLRVGASARLINGVKFFLEMEIDYAKIPYTRAEAVPVSFFLERYTLKDIKALRNMGTASINVFNKILVEAGYDRLSDA